jgi:hypothetical protein
MAWNTEAPSAVLASPPAAVRLERLRPPTEVLKLEVWTSWMAAPPTAVFHCPVDRLTPPDTAVLVLRASEVK